MNEEDYNYDEFEEEEVDPDAQRDSAMLKREKTRDAETIEKMAWRLMELGVHELSDLPLDERVRDELSVARDMKPSKARNRQVRFVAKLMRGADLEEIEEALANLKLTKASAAADKTLAIADDSLPAIYHAMPIGETLPPASNIPLLF